MIDCTSRPALRIGAAIPAFSNMEIPVFNGTENSCVQVQQFRNSCVQQQRKFWSQTTQRSFGRSIESVPTEQMRVVTDHDASCQDRQVIQTETCFFDVG
jgi:hypothetical protein